MEYNRNISIYSRVWFFGQNRETRRSNLEFDVNVIHLNWSQINDPDLFVRNNRSYGVCFNLFPARFRRYELYFIDANKVTKS